MADAVFSACFLNMCIRNGDLVGMANFAPIVNTRGCIYTYPGGIVLRSTYHVFYAYTHYMGDQMADGWCPQPDLLNIVNKQGGTETAEALDVVATTFSSRPGMAVAVVNKDPERARSMVLTWTDAAGAPSRFRMHTITGGRVDAYNDVGHTGVTLETSAWRQVEDTLNLTFPTHSVTVAEFS